MYRRPFPLITFIFLIILLIVLVISGKIIFSFFVIALFSTIFTFLIFRRLISGVYQDYQVKIEEVEARVNLLEEHLKIKNKILRELPEKAKKVFYLPDVLEKLMGLIEPEEIYNFVVYEIGRLFPQGRNVLLFIFHRQSNSLVLEASLRRKDVVIKEKKGDVFDWWVVRNNQSLLVEDLARDFRFDFKNSNAFLERNIRSLMSSPFSLGERVIGLVRVESVHQKDFSLDDLRILRSISDFVALVLEKAALFKRVEEMAIRDSLTNLFLKDYFLERANEEIKKAAMRRSCLALGMLDIDDFKKINDTYGHQVGDLVLKKVSSVLIESIENSGNLVSRFGGEEFTFLVVDTNKKTVRKLVEEIRRRLKEDLVSFRRKKISFTISIGVAFYPSQGKTSLELIEKADNLLYKAKKGGKNKVCFPT